MNIYNRNKYFNELVSKLDNDYKHLKDIKSNSKSKSNINISNQTPNFNINIRKATSKIVNTQTKTLNTTVSLPKVLLQSSYTNNTLISNNNITDRTNNTNSTCT